MNSIQFTVQYPSDWKADYEYHKIRFGDRGIIDFDAAPMGLGGDVSETTVTLANLPFRRKTFGDSQSGRIGTISYYLQIDSPDSPLRDVELPFTFGMVAVSLPSDNNEQYVKLVDGVMSTLSIKK